MKQSSKFFLQKPFIVPIFLTNVESYEFRKDFNNPQKSDLELMPEILC